VCALILITKHDRAPASADEQLILDLDLSILGASEARFDEYEAQVRREYAWVPEHVYRSRRTAVLEEFVSRPALYHTRYFADLLESPARKNLRRSLEALAGG
jgi:predicted metal-dependent HD superfamily phosphohydrolase